MIEIITIQIINCHIGGGGRSGTLWSLKTVVNKNIIVIIIIKAGNLGLEPVGDSTRGISA